MKRNSQLTLIVGMIAGVIACAITLAALAEPLAGHQAYPDTTLINEAPPHFISVGRTLTVRCNNGGTVARALSHARSGDTIAIHGTCNESVVIRIDRLRLTGVGTAIIDGTGQDGDGVIVVDAARDFVIENLIVRAGADQGIVAQRSAQGLLRNVTARDNATVGLSVDRSHLDVNDVTLIENGTGGLDAYTGSTVVVTGDLIASNNGGDGLAVNGKSFLELRGAQVTASNNSGSGVSIINDSRLQIFSFPEAQGTRVDADNNGFAGIGLLGAELGVVGAQYFGSGANELSATGNVIGFFAPAGAILSPHATARFVSQHNGVGMVMEDGARALIIGGLDVSQNGLGISADGAGTLTLVSVPPNPSSVNGNQHDISLAFGTRATIDGVAVGSISCDSTVLIRGSVTCP